MTYIVLVAFIYLLLLHKMLGLCSNEFAFEKNENVTKLVTWDWYWLILTNIVLFFALFLLSKVAMFLALKLSYYEKTVKHSLHTFNRVVN